MFVAADDEYDYGDDGGKKPPLAKRRITSGASTFCNSSPCFDADILLISTVNTVTTHIKPRLLNSLINLVHL